MLLKAEIDDIITAQRINLSHREAGLTREALKLFPRLSSHALMVSGIRRCGKSTLLLQLLQESYPKALYLNFEDPRLYDFEIKDFQRLDEIIHLRKNKVLLFDEIQVVEKWEKYVRQKLDEGFKLVITGSNASLLSRELGTKLTGRHITKELFPFSFQEFLLFNKIKPSPNATLNYMKTGGFPEYVKKGTTEILSQLFDDILVRDIAVRHGIRDVKTLQSLALFLVTNIGNMITGNKLKSTFNISSTSTIMEYFSYLEDAYLFYFVPKFSYSLKKQLVNPRKVYTVDTGLAGVLSSSFTEDQGRKFENLIYLHLRRRYNNIYYFLDRGECDFIISEKGVVRQVIQVCFELNRDNKDRELNGLFEALEFFNLKKGTIVTLNETDNFEKNGLMAQIIPYHEYFNH